MPFQDLFPNLLATVAGVVRERDVSCNQRSFELIDGDCFGNIFGKISAEDAMPNPKEVSITPPGQKARSPYRRPRRRDKMPARNKNPVFSINGYALAKSELSVLE